MYRAALPNLRNSSRCGGSSERATPPHSSVAEEGADIAKKCAEVLKQKAVAPKN